MTALSERLRRANQGAWDAMQAHRFVREIEADALSADVFGRYLANERGFVETAILIFGHALLKAPDFAARRRLCGVLHGLGGPQLGYFDRAGAAPAGPPPAAAAAFNAGPGMAVTAEIKTGRRSVISYLLSPLAQYKHESLRER